MEKIILATLFAPFILFVTYNTAVILLKMIAVIWADALGAMGFDAPGEYLRDHFNI